MKKDDLQKWHNQQTFCPDNQNWFLGWWLNFSIHPSRLFLSKIVFRFPFLEVIYESEIAVYLKNAMNSR